MNKIILRLIGLFAILSGMGLLFQNIIELITAPLHSLAATISSIVLAWIALYGGYQMMKLSTNGQKLLFIYFLIAPILQFTSLIFLTVLEGKSTFSDFKIGPDQQPSFLLAIVYLAFCITALFLLFRENNTGLLRQDNDYRHKELIGKLLSQLTPGLGRAFIGNIWTGFGLFVIYLMLISGSLYFKIGSEHLFTWILLLFDFFIKLVVWRIFAWIDWVFVKSALNAHNVMSKSTPILHSEPKSG